MSGIMLNIAGGSFDPSVPTVIGQAFGGGFFAGQIGVSSVATHYLIVGPVSSAQASNKAYKLIASSDPGAQSVIDGPANSASMNAATHPAAFFCEGLSVGGFSDWYMPAKNELEVCYFNLKPTTAVNFTSSGINPNAVPARASNYTSGNPAQTSATDFQDTGAEDFTAANYWSSTEYNANNAWNQRFTSGYQEYGNKATTFNVRAIRRVAV